MNFQNFKYINILNCINFERFDIKKIIAFSTLSQLGLIIFILSFNWTNYVFFHLISHAIFKSLLYFIIYLFYQKMFQQFQSRIYPFLNALNIEHFFNSKLFKILTLQLHILFFDIS